MKNTRKMTFNRDILKGKHFPLGSRDRLKATLANLTLLLAIIIMIIDVYGSIVHGYFWMSVIEGSSAVLFLLTYILFFHTISLQNTIYIILTVLSFLFVISLTIPGENPKLALFWLATLPIFIFFFLGTKTGAKWTLVILLFLCITLMNTLYTWLTPLYDFEFLAQITLGYAAISYLIYVLEKERFGFEHKLVESIQEKEVLYHELNHRVKNNLLMILSLIQLQISKTPSKQTKEELKITENRVSSIATLYESLHLDENRHETTTYQYLKNIIEKIQPLSSKDIKILFDIRYDLHHDQLLYSGLILNELATNAFKYAYSDVSEGKLTISIYKKEEAIFMELKDNGNWKNNIGTESLGLVIVETLIKKQLKGTVNIEKDNGTTVLLSWKE